jgi:hypothetical protein
MRRHSPSRSFRFPQQHPRRTLRQRIRTRRPAAGIGTISCAPGVQAVGPGTELPPPAMPAAAIAALRIECGAALEELALRSATAVAAPT